jgi:hypothetical protein
MEFIKQGDVAPQGLLVAVEFDANAVDLQSNVAELFGKSPQSRLHGGKQASEKVVVLERGGIEPARLGKDIRQEFAGAPDLPILRLGENPVGEFDHRTLRAVAERYDARTVRNVDLGLDARDSGGSATTVGTLMVSLTAFIL